MGQASASVQRIMTEDTAQNESPGLIPFSEAVRVQRLDANTYSANISNTLSVGNGPSGCSAPTVSLLYARLTCCS